MEKYILYFNEIDKTSLPYVGGKGANLGEMTKAGFPVPQGFCITTWAYRTFVEKSKEMNGRTAGYLLRVAPPIYFSCWTSYGSWWNDDSRFSDCPRIWSARCCWN
jgi:hypothetical protein